MTKYARIKWKEDTLISKTTVSKQVGHAKNKNYQHTKAIRLKVEKTLEVGTFNQSERFKPHWICSAARISSTTRTTRTTPPHGTFHRPQLLHHSSPYMFHQSLHKHGPRHRHPPGASPQQRAVLRRHRKGVVHVERLGARHARGARALVLDGPLHGTLAGAPNQGHEVVVLVTGGKHGTLILGDGNWKIAEYRLESSSRVCCSAMGYKTTSGRRGRGGVDERLAKSAPHQSAKEVTSTAVKSRNFDVKRPTLRKPQARCSGRCLKATYEQVRVTASTWKALEESLRKMNQRMRAFSIFLGPRG